MNLPALFKPPVGVLGSLPAMTGRDVVSMSSQEIAELVGSQHHHVRTSIERLVNKGVIACPALRNVQTTGGNNRTYVTETYVFSGEQGKRDSIIVVAQLCPEFTARLVDRWQELENSQGAIALPDFSDPAAAARAWADQFEKLGKAAVANKQLANELIMSEQKHDNFKDERGCGEAFATINEVTKATGVSYGFWALKKWCDENNAERNEVYLTATMFTYAYPAKAWFDVHGIDLNQLFGDA